MFVIIAIPLKSLDIFLGSKSKANKTKHFCLRIHAGFENANSQFCSFNGSMIIGNCMGAIK
jgi:hypothetical protein